MSVPVGNESQGWGGPDEFADASQADNLVERTDNAPIEDQSGVDQNSISEDEAIYVVYEDSLLEVAQENGVTESVEGESEISPEPGESV